MPSDVERGGQSWKLGKGVGSWGRELEVGEGSWKLGKGVGSWRKEVVQCGAGFKTVLELERNHSWETSHDPPPVLLDSFSHRPVLF
ncbi:MAG: hypothetical protein ACI9HK_006199, partial [Pirellulaceae bacterium]